MPKKALIHIPYRQYLFPKPTWRLPGYIFKDHMGIVNQLLPFLGRSECRGQPHTVVFLSFLPSCPNFHLYSYLATSPLRPKQCLHKLSQSDWENNRTYCIVQVCTSVPPSHIQLTALPLCTSSLMTVWQVNIWKRKEHVQSGLHSRALFSHPQGPSQQGKRGSATGCEIEGTEKAMLQFAVGEGEAERTFEV